MRQTCFLLLIAQHYPNCNLRIKLKNLLIFKKCYVFAYDEVHWISILEADAGHIKNYLQWYIQ